MLIDSDLYNFINSGNFHDINRCYEFVSAVKEQRHDINNTPSFNHAHSVAPEKNYKGVKPYSKRIGRRFISPTVGTRLKDMEIRAFFSVAHSMISQRVLRQRFTTKEISYFMYKNTGIKILNETIENYRFIIQQYLKYFLIDGRPSDNAYGFEKFWLERGNSRKLIIVFRQFASYDDVGARVYDTDNSKSLFACANWVQNREANIHFYNWGTKYKVPKHFPNAQFNDDYIYGLATNEVVESLKSWMGGLSLKNDERIQMHLNECVILLYHTPFDVVNLLSLIIGVPAHWSKPLRKL
jgi:hypothetical protein